MVIVYVSYAWKEEAQNRLVDELEEICAARGIELLRDWKRLDSGDSIRAFMNKIGEAGHVVLVLSEAYFKDQRTAFSRQAENSLPIRSGSGGSALTTLPAQLLPETLAAQRPFLVFSLRGVDLAAALKSRRIHHNDDAGAALPTPSDWLPIGDQQTEADIGPLEKHLSFLETSSQASFL